MNSALKAHRSGALEATEAAGTLYRYRIGRRWLRRSLMLGARVVLGSSRFIRSSFATVLMVLAAGMFSLLLVVSVVSAVTDARTHQGEAPARESDPIRKP